jgi:hypothetical protein
MLVVKRIAVTPGNRPGAAYVPENPALASFIVDLQQLDIPLGWPVRFCASSIT